MPPLRAAFAARLAERRLYVYQTRGEESTGREAIIACVDCSGSMGSCLGEVTAEAWAKACALALLDQAHQGHHDFAGILIFLRRGAEDVPVPRRDGGLPR